MADEHERRFARSDLESHFYPFRSHSLLFRYGYDDIEQYVRAHLLTTTPEPFTFAPIIHSLKDSLHLRQSLFLDPFSLVYLYSAVYEKRSAFKLDPGDKARRLYGNGFVGDVALNEHDEQQAFRGKVRVLKHEYPHWAKVDIANCFNSLYHHDLTAFLDRVAGSEWTLHFGRFLRQINLSRSIGTFPQGFYPPKTIGNFFLSFLDNLAFYKASRSVRYLDDLFLFGDSEGALREDILRIQQILSAYGLSLNAAKTQASWLSENEPPSVDAIRAGLLAKRDETAGPYAYAKRRDQDDDESDEADDGDDAADTDDVADDVDEEQAPPEDSARLSSEEIGYLRALIENPNSTEYDIRLAMTLLLDANQDIR
nr:RNA-directed DNA polymerase [Candidatus Eremiobacteraeota bacterium]